MDTEMSVDERIDELMIKIDREYKMYTNSGASEEMILDAERKLSIQFAEDFRSYLRLYASLFIRAPKRGEKGPYNEYEFTSLLRRDPDYYTVVGETKSAKKRILKFPPNAYVVQNIVGRIAYVIQLETGEVFKIEQDGEMTFLADSFTGYLRSFL